MKLKDSGKRTEFSTGAVREIDEEKGRCDLVYNKVYGRLTNDDIPEWIEEFVRRGDINLLSAVLHQFIKKYYDSYETAYLELSKHYADGAKKYSDRNMEKGLPFHCFIDSAMRHYVKFKRGDKDEPHHRAFMWNIFTLLYMMDYHPEMNDLPYKDYKEE